MKRETDGNLTKLIAISEIGRKASAAEISAHMGCDRENARKSLQRLVSAGYATVDKASSTWTTSKGTVLPLMTYALTDKGRQAVADGEPISIARRRTTSGDAAPAGADVWQWADLHAALRMGEIRRPPRNAIRIVSGGLDREPAWRARMA